MYYRLYPGVLLHLNFWSTPIYALWVRKDMALSHSRAFGRKMLRYNNTRQCFIKTKRLAAFLAKLAPQSVCRNAGDSKDQVHLHPTNTESRHQSRLHPCPARHPPQPVNLAEHNIRKSSICWPNIPIHIQLFPRRKLVMMMRIPSTTPILIQICWLMKVSTQSVVW